MNAETKRQQVRNKIVEGLNESFPFKSRNKILDMDNIRIQAKTYTPTEQKLAILRGETLTEKVTGTVTMRDTDGNVLDRVSNFTLARVPWYTPRATMIVGGNEYSIANQVRPRPGIYSRKRSNGVLETAFNLKGGQNFNLTLDAAKGEPLIEYKTTKLPLYPVLRSAGISHERIRNSWGAKLADTNARMSMSKQGRIIDKLYRKVVPEYHRKDNLDTKEKSQEIFQRYSNAKMSPEVNKRTIGRPYDHVSPDSMLEASNKLLKLHRNTSEVDDRDNLDFKSLYAPEDFLKEVIKINSREVAHKTAIKMEATQSLKKALPAGPFTKGILKFINSSQLVSVPTAVNPVELIDSSMRVTSLGEGGISTERAIPDEARHVHPSQINALDPFRTPESFRAGVDVRAAMGVKKDAEGNIFVPIIDLKKKRKIKYVRAGAMLDGTIAFPNQKMTGIVDALRKGKIRRVRASTVQYQMPDPSLMYSPTTNLVPFMESLQGNRTVMGSKMQTQALSLTGREEPYVQVKSPTGDAYEKHMAQLINPYTPISGTVTRVDGDYIYIQPEEAKTAAPTHKKKKLKEIRVAYDTNMPLAAKTFLSHNLTIKPGDYVKAGQQLGESNFTRNNVLALGRNLSVAYMPYAGANSNDAVVISDTAAKKLTSERMYKMVIPVDKDTVWDKQRHKVYYGQTQAPESYNRLDSAGIIKPGTIINPGEALTLGLRKSTTSADDVLLGRLSKSLARPYRENNQMWEHDHPGEVIDVVKTARQIALTVKTKEPMGVGDKLSGRYGNKGVVSRIIADDRMIQDEHGKPIDIIMTSAGVVSRTNPAVIIETAIGKVVDKTKKPILVENLTGRDNVKWAKELLKKHKIRDKETVYDPRTGKKIKNVFVGKQYVMKLMKSTDTNYSARGLGTYDVHEQPTKGGTLSAKALGKMEFDALIGHNARNVLKEAATIKSQKNDEYWRAVQLGYPIPQPKTTFAADKFLSMLTGAGVRVDRNNSRMSLAPLTDKNIQEMSSGEIRDAKIIRAKDLMPESRGLFDPAITGGLTGTKWGHINLAEPIVSPVFREPVRRFLGMTNTQLNHAIKTKGGKYIRKQLANIDLDKHARKLHTSMKTKSASSLDNEIKQLKYIKALKAQNLRPEDAYVISKVPVIPPRYRPVLPGKGGQEIMYGDANPLYRDLIFTNNQFKTATQNKNLQGEAENLRPVLNAAVGAVYGVNEPISAKSRARGHKGFLTYISGTNSPKTGYFHSKLLKRTQDIAGRGTIVPDNTLGIDEVGLPEDMLWTMYDKFIIQKLVRNGYKALEAAKMVKEKHPTAKRMLDQEVKERPVMLNRAPTLHRYSIVGAYPKMVPGKTIRINPFAEEGFNADYDGDTMMIHAPVGSKAVAEVKNMTLSNLLYSDKNKNDLLVFPQHEAIMGLAHASTQDAHNSRIPIFNTEGDAKKAYHAGLINMGTRVNIRKGSK